MYNYHLTQSKSESTSTIEQQKWRVWNNHKWQMVLLGFFTIIGLFITSQHNYLLFHALVELGSVVVAWSVFLLIWSARHLKIHPAFVMLGIGDALVGALDLLHTLAYKGMGVFPGTGADLATQLWIAARFIDTAALMFFPLCFIAGWLARWGVFTLITAALVMLGSIFIWGLFPECFNAKTGLTPFKTTSEYIVMAALGISAALTYRKRDAIGNNVTSLLIGAILATILSEYFFTIYASPFGLANTIGHLLKVVSFILIYRALIVESIERPLEVLAHGLREETQRYSRILETTVDGFWILDMQGRFCDANASAERMTGYPRSNLLSMQLSDIEANESAEETALHMKMVAENGYDLFETRLRRRDGSCFDAEVSCSFLPHDNKRFIGFVRDISERKKTEAQLRFHAALSEQVSDAIIATDLNLNITSWNAAAERIYGWSAHEAHGQQVDTLLNTVWLDQQLEKAQQVLKETGAWKGEVHQQNRGGQLLAVEASVSWIYDITGTCIGGVTVNRDITERKKATRMIEESEARYRGIVSVLPDLLIRIDTESRFTDVQSSSPEILIAPVAEVIGKTLWEIFPPDIAELINERLHTAIECGKLQIFQYALNLQGPVREFEARMVPCGKTEVLTIVRDITEQKRMATDLAAEHAILQAIFNASPDILVFKNNDSIYDRVNPAFCAFVGRESMDIIGRTDYDLFPEDDARQYIVGDAEVLRSGIPENEEWQVMGHAGRRWLQIIKTAVRDASGRTLGVLCTGRDVSEYHLLNKLLLDASQNEQVKFAQELHDGLCQDLKSLEIDAALLEDMTTNGDENARSLAAAVGQKANLAVRKAYSIVEGRLPMGLNPENFSVALSELVEKTRNFAGDRVFGSIHEDLAPCDDMQSYQLYRIAQEAMNNALRHSNATRIELRWGMEDDLKLLSIKDYGIGIGSNKAKASHGMGLQVMLSRAQAIGARLTVLDMETGGTEIRVRLKDE